VPPPYFITFRTYGTWLHGSREGSVDDEHNLPGHEFAPVNLARAEHAASLMTGSPFTLDPAARAAVLSAIGGVCRRRGWTVWAVHVRSNHLHVVVTTGGQDVSPERVMNDFKAWATRRLVQAGHVRRGARVWVTHGSTRWLNTERGFAGACHYTYELQERGPGAEDAWAQAWERAKGEREA
jgi:REP element-mobilizing transposase RayT